MIDTWLASGSHKKILLLRHGEIETAGPGKRFIGQLDLALSDNGRHQARTWQSRLATLSLGAIVTSDLSRCRETARIIAGGDQKIERVSALREIDLGQWDGERVSDVKERWPDAYRRRGLDMAGFRPPGGESFLDLHKRVLPLFESAVRRLADPLLIVTHAGVIRVIVCHILGMPVENLFRIALDYGALTLIDRQANGYRVQALNLVPA